ncbi:MAG: hypothetical protein PHV34_16830 [Verrucomicrobiae bacterium]|nr:hypothetical protein [Verrucomicrobiae bacterium]
MLRLSVIFFGCFLFALTCLTQEAEPEIQKPGYKIAKVNSQYVDLEGYVARGAGDFPDQARYQRGLERSGKFSAIRFSILWKAPSTPTPNLMVRLDACGEDPKTGQTTTAVRIRRYPTKSHISAWAILEIEGDALARFGRLKSWKVSLYQEDELMAERKSFMWHDKELEKKNASTTDQQANPNNKAAESPAKEAGR